MLDMSRGKDDMSRGSDIGLTSWLWIGCQVERQGVERLEEQFGLPHRQTSESTLAGRVRSRSFLYVYSSLQNKCVFILRHWPWKGIFFGGGEGGGVKVYWRNGLILLNKLY